MRRLHKFTYVNRADTCQQESKKSAGQEENSQARVLQWRDWAPALVWQKLMYATSWTAGVVQVFLRWKNMEMKIKKKTPTEEEIDYLKNKEAYEDATREDSIWRYLNRWKKMKTKKKIDWQKELLKINYKLEKLTQEIVKNMDYQEIMKKKAWRDGYKEGKKVVRKWKQ